MAVFFARNPFFRGDSHPDSKEIFSRVFNLVCGVPAAHPTYVRTQSEKSVPQARMLTVWAPYLQYRVTLSSFSV